MKAFIAVRPGKTPSSFEIEASLPFFLTGEEKGVTAFTPLLDFSTCGTDRKDAEDMFKKGVIAFLEELIAMGTLDEVLREHGWRKTHKPTKFDRWIPPEFIFQKQRFKGAVAAPA